MKIIGLTGGIASGKNYVAEIFAKKGAVIFDADKEVHELFESDKSTIAAVKKKFPQSFVKGKINRKILREIVFPKGNSAVKNSSANLKILEKILHPKVRKKYLQFVKSAEKKSKEIVVLNIPLLLETKGYKCDKVIAIIAPKKIQKERFLERAKKLDPKNFVQEKKDLEKKFELIRSKQISNAERKKQADFVILNDGLKDVVRQVEKVLDQIL